MDDDRAAVTVATARIDHELANDPTGVGQDVAEGLRRHASPPLMIFFEVRPDDRIVEVVRVRRSRAVEDGE
jgi:plasmid stabilization system protein ParE